MLQLHSADKLSAAMSSTVKVESTCQQFDLEILFVVIGGGPSALVVVVVAFAVAILANFALATAVAVRRRLNWHAKLVNHGLATTASCLAGRDFGRIRLSRGGRLLGTQRGALVGSARRLFDFLRLFRLGLAAFVAVTRIIGRLLVDCRCLGFLGVGLLRCSWAARGGILHTRTSSVRIDSRFQNPTKGVLVDFFILVRCSFELYQPTRMHRTGGDALDVTYGGW